MKLFLTAFSVIGLTACSPSVSNKIFSSENLVAPVSSGVSGDYGSAIVGSSFDDKIFVFTKGANDSSSSTVTLVSEDFSVSSSVGCNKNLTKASDKCSVKVKFLKNKVAGEYSASLRVGSAGMESVISLTAIVLPVPSLAEAPLGLNGFNVLEGTNVKNLDGSFLDFGILSYSQSLAKVITLKKIGPTPELPVISFGGMPSKYSVDKNYCTSPLKNGEQCLVRIVLSHNMTNIQVVNPVDEVLSVNGVDKTVAVSIFNPYVPEEAPQPKVAVIKFYSNGSLIVDNLNLGNLGAKSSEAIISVKNEGDAAATGAALGLTTETSVFSIGSNTCTASLGVGKSCQFKVKANPGLTTGTHAASASYAGVGIVISGTTSGTPPTCPTGHHLDSNSTCVSNVRNCSVLPSNATAGSETYSSGAWGSCVVSACQSGYNPSGNSCVQQQAQDYKTVDLLSAQDKAINIENVVFEISMNSGYQELFYSSLYYSSAFINFSCNSSSSEYYYDVYIANDGNLSNLWQSGMALWSGSCDTPPGYFNLNSVNVTQLQRPVYGEDLYVAIVRNYFGEGPARQPEVVKVLNTGVRLYNIPPFYTSGRVSLMGDGGGNNSLSGRIHSGDLDIDPTYMAYAPSENQWSKWMNCSFDFNGEPSSNCYFDSMMGEIIISSSNSTNMCGNYSLSGSLTLIPEYYYDILDYVLNPIPLEISLPSCDCSSKGMEEDYQGQCVCPGNMNDLGGYCGCTEYGTTDMGGYCGCDNSAGYYDNGNGSCEYLQCSSYGNEGDCMASPISCWWDEGSSTCN